MIVTLSEGGAVILLFSIMQAAECYAVQNASVSSRRQLPRDVVFLNDTRCCTEKNRREQELNQVLGMAFHTCACCSRETPSTGENVALIMGGFKSIH